MYDEYYKQDDYCKKEYKQRIDDLEYMLTKPDWMKKLLDYMERYQ